MHLKRLELCGFKSFADKTRLEFEPGITAIIGPNGCGKSNTADAIRWCLGEQSARSLRSHQMMDVIFGGSQSRQTTGMAEVSITFDNATKTLPIDYSEVTVTRRLFRSGESEYFLNKTQCRLKDIKDLFLDTGIGAEGYSVMEQGKVEFILSARPEERRELFEEAAGVAKFKARREETLRKLEKVDIDMNRVNDMLTMLKEQINALDLAAKKARQYQKNQEDLKRLEIASMAQKLSSSASEIERLNGELNPKQMEYERLNTAFDQTDAEISQLRQSQLEKDEIYVKLQGELSQVKSEINLSDERIRNADTREKELLERKDLLSREIEQSAVRASEFDKTLSELTEMIKNISARVQVLEKEYQDKQSHAESLRNRINEIQREEIAVRENLFSLAEERVRRNNDKNRLLSLQARCQGQVLSLNKDLAKSREQLTPLIENIAARENELNELKLRMNSLTEKQNDCARNIASLEQRSAELNSSRNAFKEKIVSLESRHQTLLEWEQKDPQRLALRTVLSLNIPGISGPVGSLIRITTGAEEIVGAALGEKLNYLIAETAEAAQRAIEHLENNNLGRVTFIVLERIPEISGDSSLTQLPGSRSLLSLLSAAPEYDRALRFICQGTLIYGKTVYGNAVLSGGGQIAFDKPLLIDENLRNIQTEIEGLRAELSRSEAEFISIAQETAARIEEKKLVDMEAHKLEAQSEFLSSAMGTVRDEAEYVKKEISLTEEDIKKQEAEALQISNDLLSIDASFETLAKEETGLNERLAGIDSTLRAAREEENQITPLLTESKVAWATQANELSGRTREEEKLRSDIQNIALASEQARNESAETDNKIIEQKTIQHNESQKLKQLSVEQEQKDIQVQQSLSERQEIYKQLETKNNTLHELRKQIETVEEDLHAKQMELRSFELQCQSFEQRLKEDYSLSFAEAKEQYANIEVDEEEISRLKRRLESMGPVNLAAPEEYANLEERYNFLLNQQQDLIKAKEDLHQVIQKINQTTKENFKKTFDQIRENFRNLYHQLFEGGEADLQLTDENDLLESGVDIMAQPPGKKLQNIALLSGGEKALTAIALLFAFYMVRPSPFCILDEVDAPLDEANVGRYINMVKTFAAQSQFLAITHNKRTMSMADVLYGVTMEELGVSKVISVRMQKEEMPAIA